MQRAAALVTTVAELQLRLSRERELCAAATKEAKARRVLLSALQL